MASIGWTKSPEGQGRDLNDCPHLKRWYDTMMSDEEKKILFNQRSR